MNSPHQPDRLLSRTSTPGGQASGRTVPSPMAVRPSPIDYEEHRDCKRRLREDALDMFEADCDYRTREGWP